MTRALRAQATLAVRAALVAGVVFGLPEGLEAVDRNAFAFASQYVWLYAVVPVQLWTLLALVLVLPCAAVVAALDRRASEGRGLWRYGAILGGAGAAFIVAGPRARAAARLQQVGTDGATVDLLLFALAGGMIIAAAAVLAAAAAWYEGRTRDPLRYGALIGLAVCLLGLIPAAGFFMQERQWRPAPRVAAPADAATLPNLLLVSIDTLRADAVGSYGATGGLTPNLDRLARDGARFDQAITSSSWTLPAMASLFTGLNVRRHGAGWVTNPRDPLGRAPLSPSLWTLTRAMRERGYETAAIITNPYLALRYGFGAGFDAYENLSIQSEIVVAFQHTALVRAVAWVWPGLLPGDRSAMVTERATGWLRRRPAERPFFLWLHYIDPHAPYIPGSGARVNSFRGDSLLAGAGDAEVDGVPPDIARLRSGEVRPNQEQKEQMRRLYDGEVAEVDAAIGGVLDELDELGLTASTIVLCVSDHGEEFWEHSGVEHGRTVYEEVVRVPVLLRWPGRVPAGKEVESLAGLIDIAPTVIDLLGWPPPAGLDGRSLREDLGGETASPAPILIESMHFAEERVGLRTPTHKYVRWADGKEEAYDLIADPRELVDLAGVDEVIEPLRATMRELDRADTPPGQAIPVHPSGATREALRALGYVD